jgi:predicted PurR-regulated permease PerM
MRRVALPVQLQIRYWIIAAVALVAILWLLGDVILPFVLGGAIAYLLDPIADWLERHGLSRIWSTITITFFGVIVFLVLALLVIPTLVEQAIGLFDAMPTLLGQLETFLTTRFPALLDPDSQMRQSLVALGDMIQSRSGEIVDTILNSAMSLINVVVLIVLVPVVTFYLLLDWDKLVARVDDLLPRDHAPTVRRLASEIDRTLAAFIRGQGAVCLILGIYYAAALMLVGLNFGAVIGALAGLVTFIPYVGALLGGVLAIGLALFQFWGDWVWIALVAGIFFFGQFVEGNILSPNLVGQSVGLHPVWLIFALSAFGTLFGFVGMLVAVPVSAALGVLARFALERYREGRLYQGTGAGSGSASDGDQG